MERGKISRREFLGGTAAVVGAAVLPAITNMAPAAATPATGFPGTMTPWVPLDAKAAARQGYEIYRGKHQFQSG
ncbi:MAG: twin-arginine translocation signal domain-containing protein [Coriobacteriia bacterium]